MGENSPHDESDSTIISRGRGSGACGRCHLAQHVGGKSDSATTFCGHGGGTGDARGRGGGTGDACGRGGTGDGRGGGTAGDARGRDGGTGNAVCLGVPKEYCDCALLPLFVHLFMVLFLGMSDSPTEEDRECDDHCIISESYDFTPKWIGCDCSTFIVLV